MKKLNQSSKGFTLVEIMIVVVIIGLLAAMAIPAFQKVRTNSLGKAMVNDARQIAGACQQILLQDPNNAGFAAGIPLVYTSATGAISCGVNDAMGNDYLTTQVRTISKGYAALSAVYNPTPAAGAAAFTMSHTRLAPAEVAGPGSVLNTGTGVGTPVAFDTEGKTM